MLDKRSDLAGPGISTYEKVDAILPTDYASLLGRKQTQKAIYDVKEYIEKGLENADWVEVLSGVAAGDVVITSGHFTMAHDTPVRFAEPS